MNPAHRISTRRLLAIIAAVVVVGAVIQMGFVWWADPYGARGSSGPKITAVVGAHRRLYKARDVARVMPDMLLCGTSRVEQALEPSHPALHRLGYSPYVAAMAGATIYEQQRMIQHAHALHPLKAVWVEIAFMITSADHPRWNPGFSESRLAVSASGRAQPLHQLADIPLLLSLDSQGAAWRTLRRGSSPRRTLAETFDRGHYFPRNLDFSGNNRTSFVRGAQAAWRDHCQHFRALNAQGTNPHLDDLAALIAFCRTQHIAVTLFFTPEHAYHGWLIQRCGLWPTYAAFKQQVATLAGDQIPLWDFSAAESFTTETIPPATQSGRTMVHYNDAGHYTTAIGRRIIDTLATGEVRDGFGVRVNTATLPEEMHRQAALLPIWAAQQPADAAEIEALINTP